VSAGDGRPPLSDEDRRRIRHDLRTPLTIVAGFAEVLAADRAISEADRREFAQRICDAADELREIVDELLEEPEQAPGGGGPQAA
jgi:signal transduction histidine kinase